MAGTLIERLQARFGTGITGQQLEALDPWIEVTVESLPAVCRYLKQEADLQFDYLSCITVVDTLETDPKKAAKIETPARLELVYHLFSTVYKRTLVLKVMLPRWKDDRPGELPEVSTVSDIWRTADWHERETYDLSGVRFLGHRNLRRILCPEDWIGYPLRKDYEQPLEYHGIRGR